MWTNVMWFTALGFLRPAIQVFLIPMYLAKLTPAEYGILALVGLVATLLGSVSGLKLDMAAHTFYYDYNHERKRLLGYIGQVFTINLAVAVVLGLGLWVLGPVLFRAMFKSGDVLFHPYGMLAITTMLLESANAIYYSFLKNEMRVRVFVGLNVFSVLSTVALQAIFVLHYGMGVWGILTANLIPAALLLFFILLRNPWLVNFSWDVPTLKPSVVFALGFLPISFLSVFEKRIDRIILEWYMDLEQVGLYALLVGVVGFFEILVNAYHNAVRPLVYQSLKRADAGTVGVINSYFKTYTSLGLLGLGGILLIGGHLHWVTDSPKYLGIVEYFPFFIAASVPLIIIRYQILVVLFYKKTLHLSIITIFKTLALVGTMMWLIPRYGIYGAIGSLAISYFLYFIVFRVVELKWNTPSIHYVQSLRQCIPFLCFLGLYLILVPVLGTSIASLFIFSLTLALLLHAEWDKAQALGSYMRKLIRP